MMDGRRTMDIETTLPPGWTQTTLGDAFKWGSGGTPLRSRKEYYGGDIPWAIIGDLNDGIVTETQTTITEAGLRDSSAKWVEEGSVLVAMYGSIGKLGMAGKRLTTNQAIAFAKCDSIDAKYLFYYLLGERSNLNSLGSGATQLNISQTVIKAYPFPVAPLPEQRRIVARIEELFTCVDAGMAALKRVQAALRHYKGAVLKAACEGRLVSQDPNDEPAPKLFERILAQRRTKWESDLRAKGKDPKKAKYVEPRPPDTHGLQELPPGWCWTRLDQLTHHVTSGSRGWARFYAPTGSLFIRVGNFNRQSKAIDLEDMAFVKAPRNPEAVRTRLQIGDLLITITADVGMVGVVDEHVCDGRDAYINQHVCLVRLMDKEVADFVAYVLASEPLQMDFRHKQYGATKKGLNLDDVRSLTIPLAPLAEQHRIVAELERRLSVVRELEHTVNANIARAERMRQAILKRAFEGKLCPQTSADEPASALLERIQAPRRGVVAGPRTKVKKSAEVRGPSRREALSDPGTNGRTSSQRTWPRRNRSR